MEYLVDKQHSIGNSGLPLRHSRSLNLHAIVLGYKLFLGILRAMLVGPPHPLAIIIASLVEFGLGQAVPIF